MKYINLFFHMYQPPVQDEGILAEIVRQSYRPLTRQLAEFKDLKFTLNINYSLVELLHEGAPEIIRNIRRSFRNGNLELTATGAYHPIFPLIPEGDVKRQLAIQQAGLPELLGESYCPDGVFSPEMAFDGRLVSLFRELGYRWTIADDGNLSYYDIQVPFDKIYTFEGLAVFLRSNHWTNRFANYQGQWPSGDACVEELISDLRGWMDDEDAYLIIALDGETFGHHHPELGEEFLAQFFDALLATRPELRTVHLSQLYGLFPHVPQFIPPGSWSTDQENVGRRDYFSWWKSPRNRIHVLQWQFTDLVLNIVRRTLDDEMNRAMDKALYSCQYWWASYWKFNPGEIYRGAFNMMRVLQAVAETVEMQPEEWKEGQRIFKELIIEVEKKRNGWEN